MRTALYDAGGGDERDLGALLQLLERDGAAAAHRGTDLTEGDVEVVLHLAGIGHVAVDALLKFQRLGAAHVVPLPVLGAVGAFAPVLLHVVIADAERLRGRLVEAGEVATHHQEVGTHRQGQRHVVIVHDAAVATDGHIDPRLLAIGVAGTRHIDQRRSLSTSDALLLTGDADRSAADAHLDEVRPGVDQVAEALAVYDVACAHGDVVVRLDPFEGLLLPFGIAVGGVDAERIYAGLDERRDTLLVVARIDARADEQLLRGVG